MSNKHPLPLTDRDKEPDSFAPATDVLDYSDKSYLLTYGNWQAWIPKALVSHRTDVGVWYQQWFKIKWRYVANNIQPETDWNNGEFYKD